VALIDPELVSRAVKGDPDAVEDLVAAVRPALVRYCRRYLTTYPGGYELAEDVTQEACLAIVRALPTYRDTSRAFERFAYAVTTHKIVDARRTASKRTEAETGAEPDPTLEDPQEGPADRVIQAERLAHDLELLENMLALLPRDKARLLRLRAEGVPAEQVGRRLGMKANAVRVMQHRALQELRGRLG
jgi:RNA polymerase sigma-70 factor (ECF subfamily)